MLLMLFTATTGAFGQATQTFTTNGSWTCPPGITSITVECWGGGGRGGSLSAGTGAAAGGGGGAYARSTIAVIPGTPYNFTVGTGSSSTSPGVSSSFGSPTMVLAAGGSTPADNSNISAAGGAAGSSIGDFRFSGGNGATGTNGSFGGGGGSSGGTGSDGNYSNTTTNAFAGGVIAGGGNGGTGRTTTEGNGTAGSQPGGGGGGALRTNSNIRTGGNGANGQILLTWNCSINLTSPTGSDGQTVCSNKAMDTISYALVGSPTVNITGLPSGVTFTYTTSNGILKIFGSPLNSGNYTINLPNGCTGKTGIISVTATPQGNLTTSTPTFCATGGAGMLTWTASAGSDPYKIVYNDGSADRSVSNITSGVPFAVFTSPVTSTTIYTLRSVQGNNGCIRSIGFTGPSATITINSAPSITVQPSTGTQNLCQGGTGAAMSVTASGGGLNYQWYRNTSPVNSGGVSISGANLASYTPSTSTAGVFYYYCIVSGSCTPTATSNVSGAITINAKPVVISPSTVCVGSTGNLTPSTGGTWTSSNNSLATVTNGGIITGISAGSPTFTFTDSSTGCSTISSSVSIVAPPHPLLEFTQGQGDVTFTISSACGQVGGGGQNDLDIRSGSDPGAGSLYQWQTSIDQGTTWKDGKGPTATTNQYVLDPAQIDFINMAGVYYFRLLLTPPGGCQGVSATTLILTVTASTTLTGGTIGNNQSYNSSTTPQPFVVISPPTGGGTTNYTNYKWYSSTDQSNWYLINGATSATYSPGLISQTTYFRRTITVGTCTEYSNTVTVSIIPCSNPPATPGSIGGSTLVCQSTPGLAYSISPVSGASNYTWAVSSGSITTGQGSTSVTITSGTANFNVSVTASNGCGTSGASVLTVNVSPPIGIFTLSGSVGICTNNSASVSLSGSEIGVSYQLRNNTTNVNVGTLSGTGSSISFPTGVLTSSTTYNVLATNGSGCTQLMSGTTTITVNPKPADRTVAASPSTVCKGSSTNITVASSDVNTSYQLRNNSGNVNINGSVTGNGGTINLPTLALNTNTTFNVLASTIAAGCILQMTNTPTITVTSPVTPTFASIGPFCQNTTPTALPTSSTNGIFGTWSPSTINTSTAGSSSYLFTPNPGQCAGPTSVSITITAGITPTFTPIGPLCQFSAAPALPGTSNNGVSGFWSPTTISTAAVGTLTYTFTASAGQCANPAPVTMNITITAQPVTTFNPMGPYCQFSTADPLPTTSTNGITGTWSPSTISTATPGTSTYTFYPGAGQCGSTASLYITINQLPTASISYAGSPFCTSASPVAVSLSGSGPYTGGIFSASPTPPTGGLIFNSSSGTIRPNFSAIGTYTVYYTIAAANGCGQVQASTSVEIKAPSPAGISISALPVGAICPGTSVTFTATPTNGGTSPQYSWKVNGIVVSTGSPTFTSTALADADAVTCDLTSNDPCASPNTATSNTITMSVTSGVPVSVAIAAVPSVPVCAGTSVTFTATPTNGGGTPAYQWKVNGTNAGTNSPTFTSTTLLNGDLVTCILTSNLGCTTGNPATSNTITMAVSANLPVSVSIAKLPAGAVCAGTSVTYTATPINGGTTPAYQWKVNGTNAGTDSPTFTSSALLNGDIVTCVLTSNATCKTGSPATSNAVTMAVNPNLPVSVSIAALPAGAICTGTSVTFTATPTNGGATPAYQWKLNGVNVGTNSTTYTSTTLSNGDIVTCVLTSNATCATGSPATSNAVTMVVNSSLPVSVSVAAVPAGAICAGTSVTFTATPTNGGTTPSYQWKVNATNVGTNSPTFTSTTLANGDVVRCVFTSNAACVTGNPATSSPLTMTVNPTLPVSVSIAALPAGAVCAGTSVTYTATPTNGGTTPAYQWKVNGVNAGTNVTYTYTPVSGDAINCVLTSNATCATGSPATSNTVNMTVNANLPASVSIAASANPVCAGTSVTFTATPTNGGTTPAYQWKVNGTNAGTNSATYAYIPANGDAVTCVMTSNALCATGSPATSNSLSITVNPLLPVSVSIAALPSGAICAGTSVTFTATPTNGGATPAYQWKVNGVNAGTNSATYSYTPVNGDAVTCVLTSNALCATGSPATSNSLSITVNPILPVSVSIAAVPAGTICEGTSVTFTATPTNGGTTPAYQWKVNGTDTGTNSNTYTSSVLQNSDVVTCVLTSNSGCTSGNPATSNAINMSVNPSLLVSISISASSNPVCSGTAVTFTATAINGGSTPSYQWKKNGLNVGTNPTYSTVPANGNTITCVLTSNATCATGSPAISNTITMAVLSAPVSVSIGASANPVCAGITVTFTANPTNGGTTPVYQWKVGGVNVGTNSTTYAYVPNSGDVITCVLTSNANCAVGSPATSNSITMTVNPLLPVSVSIAAAPSSTVCAGTSVTYTATPTNGGTTPSYQWKKNGSNVGTNSATYSYTPVNGDIITCVLTSNATCKTGSPATSNGITMTVNPIVPVSVSIGASANPVCSGTSVTFTATPVNGGTTPSYQWQVNGINAGTDSPTYSYTPVQGDAVTCILTSNAACVSGNPATSNSISMTVNPNLPVSVTIGASANPVCAGTSVTFTATPTNGGSTPGYQWKVNGTNAGTNSATYTYTPANGDAVTCVLTSNATCATGSPATSNIISMTVNIIVTPTFTILTDICAGATAPTLPTTSDNGISGTWSPATVSNSSSGTYTFTPDGGHPCSPSVQVTITVHTSVTTLFTLPNEICAGSPAPTLPAVSDNGISGTWVPAIVSNTSTGTYTFTPDNGHPCASTVIATIKVNPIVTPTFNPIPPLCLGSTPPELQLISNEGISGTWAPSVVSNAATATYTFTPDAGHPCAVPTIMIITVNPPVIPDFTAIPDICSGTTAPSLPSVSNNGVSGNWNPATISNTISGSYTFTPNAGQCADSKIIGITVIPSVMPLFDPIGPLVLNSTPPVLPASSTNGIAGTWSPSTISTSATGTFTFTFTPNSGQCGFVTTIDITIIANIVPDFTQMGPYCQGANADALPTKSNNNITGLWSPPAINTSTLGTSDYTFTPDAGQGALPATMSITILPLVMPTFAAIGPLPQNGLEPTLPLTSVNGFTGTWNPPHISTSAIGTFTYTFTPDAGQCASSTTISVTITAGAVPVFNAFGPYCAGSFPDQLPDISNNGIIGSWNPTVINTAVAGTFVFTFTPNAGQGAVPIDISIVIQPHVTATFAPIGPLTQNTVPPALPSTSSNGITGTWSPTVISTANTGAFTFTFTPAAGQCSSGTTIQITITAGVIPVFTALGPYCAGATPGILPVTSNNNISGSWNPTVISTATAGTFVYTFTPSAGQGAVSTQMSVLIRANVVPLFNTIGPLSLNAIPPALPQVSTNGVTGTWSPPVIITAYSGTFTFTFTPTVGQCATGATIQIVVSSYIVPSFTDLGPYCAGAVPGILPAKSNDNITGTWEPPIINTSSVGTDIYVFTPNAGQGATSTEMTISIMPNLLPTFTQIGPLTQYSLPPVLSSTSLNGLSGTWNPSSVNTNVAGTTTFTFTPNQGQCATVATMDITITSTAVPTFNTLGPYCVGSVPDNLPAVSTNNIRGTWSPPFISTSSAGTRVYNFNPDTGQNALPGSIVITVLPNTMPTFAPIGPLLLNSAAPALPVKSINNITGSWSPSTINTAAVGTFTFTFTPDPSQCALPATISITITSSIIPVFTNLGPYCAGSRPDVLPAISVNNITGTWKPSAISTSSAGTTSYVFTPDFGQGASSVTMSITVLASVIPTFNQIGPLTQYSVAPVLPLTSLNGITGTWNPSTISTSTAGTFLFTFTPAAGQCSLPVTMNIPVTNNVIPLFKQFGPYCVGSIPDILPTTSSNNITGRWNPSVISTSAAGTGTYIFTPDNGQNAVPLNITITILASLTPTFPIMGTLALNSVAPPLPAKSLNNITGNWSPPVISTASTGTARYIFTPDAGQCATQGYMDITVSASTIPAFVQLGPYCIGSTPDVLPLVSTNNVAGTWNPPQIRTTDAGTTTYTFTPSPGQDAIAVTMDISVLTREIPLFNQIGTICLNSLPPVLPITSQNDITGTWTPSKINTAEAGTFTFTFNPYINECAKSTTMQITIAESIFPVFNPIGILCQNTVPPVLPTTSLNGVRGTWVPATISTDKPGKSFFTFTPTGSTCSVARSIEITVDPSTDVKIRPVSPLCLMSAPVDLFADPAGGVFTGTGVNGSRFNPATAGLGTHYITYTYTSPGGCSNQASISVSVYSSPVLMVTNPAPVCGPNTVNLENPSITIGSGAGLIFTYWLDQDGNQPVSDPKSVGGGTYYIMAQGVAPCTVVMPVTVTVIAPVGTPVPITFSGSEPTCQLGHGTAVTPYSSSATNGTITWSASPPEAGRIDPVTGVMTWNNGFSGSATIIATATGCNGTLSAERKVVIAPEVGQPVFDLGLSSLRGSGVETVIYHATAANSISLTYSIDPGSLAGGVTINSITGAVSYPAGWTGPSVITAKAEGCNGPNFATHSVMSGSIKPVLTIYARSKSKEYGSNLPELEFYYEGLVDNDKKPLKEPGINTTAAANSPVGEYDIIVSGAEDPKYNIRYVSGKLSVISVTLKIIAENKIKTIGSPLPVLTVIYTGLTNGDISTTKVPEITTTATQLSGPGVYPVTVCCAADPNYIITYKGGQLTVTENTIVPEFSPIGPFCQNSIAPALPLTSSNGITGTWQPNSIATSAAGTTAYVFTPAVGQGAVPVTIDITVNALVIPAFDPIGQLNLNATAPVLPAISLNGITGTWNPATVNTSIAGTTAYIFTPDKDQCAASTSINITVRDAIVPAFTTIDTLCQNVAAPILPGTSLNSITGKWKPSTINTTVPGTITYTFTPDPGQNAASATMAITVTAPAIPAFGSIGPFGKNENVPALPKTSENGITGSWSPATVNTAVPGTKTFSFTPDAGQCAITITIDIIVVDIPCPVVNLGSNIKLCSKDPVKLRGDNGSGDTYVWSRIENSKPVVIGHSDSLFADRTGIYILAVTKAGCTVKDTISVKLLDPQLFVIDSIHKKDNTCFEGKNGSIEIVLHGTGSSYQYSIDNGVFSQANSLFENVPHGDYQIHVSEDSLCFIDYPVAVAIGPKDSLHIGFQLTPPGCDICTDGKISLDITGGWGGYQITIDGRPAELVTSGLGVGTYTLEVTDARGCMKSIDIKLDSDNTIPNVITTNGDGINDFWRISMLAYYPESVVKVFSVTGKMVFESAKGYPVPWDGKDNGNPCPMGTYYYLINLGNGSRPLTGYLTILR